MWYSNEFEEFDAYYWSRNLFFAVAVVVIME